MTTEALRRGFDILTAVWPSRYASQTELRAGMVAYADLVGELTDDAWLAACREASKTLKFFPVPAELTELAEAYAEDKTQQQIDRLEFQRIAESTAEVRHMLAAGAISAKEGRGQAGED